MNSKHFIFIIGVLSALLYIGTIGHDYAYDDAIAILDNQDIQRGFEGIPNLFVKKVSDRLEDYYGYRPIPQLTFAAEIGIFGLNPHVGHVTNLLLYSLICMGIFLTLRRIFPDFGEVFAFTVTVLFLVHPLHVEVVANIKSRDELLALGFGLLSLNFFYHAYQTDQRKWLGVAFFFTILSFLSKESGFILCLTMFLVLLLPGKNRKTHLMIVGSFLVGLVALRVFIQMALITNVVPAANYGEATHNNAILGSYFLEPHSLGVILPNIGMILFKYFRNFYLGFL